METLDPRVGVIIRNGKPAYYASRNLDVPPEQVVAHLDGRPVPRKPRVRKRLVRAYTVTWGFKYPSVGDRPRTFATVGSNAAEARKAARRWIDVGGYLPRIDGPIWMKVELDQSFKPVPVIP